MSDIKFIGYYTTDTCKMGSPFTGNTVNITKHIIEDEMGTISVIPPPLNYSQIKPVPVKAPLINKPLDLSWASIKAMDNRVSIDTTNILVHFSLREIKSLLYYLAKQIEAAHIIETELKTKWNINKTFKQIVFFAPGRFNNASASPSGTVEFLVGDPKGHSAFFAAPTCLYAHELAHYLSFFDKNGLISPLHNKSTFEAMKRNKWAPPFKYLEGAPFASLPHKSLPKQLDDDETLFYTANQLLADKVAAQLCGYEQSKIDAERMIKQDLPDVWEGLRRLVLAREHGLTKYERELSAKIARKERLWTKYISTQELVDSLTKFYRGVSLKRQ